MMINFPVEMFMAQTYWGHLEPSSGETCASWERMGQMMYWREWPTLGGGFAQRERPNRRLDFAGAG